LPSPPMILSTDRLCTFDPSNQQRFAKPSLINATQDVNFFLLRNYERGT